VCLEGHKKGCPHLLPDEAPAPAAEAVETPRIVKVERYEFTSGEKLIVDEVIESPHLVQKECEVLG
jgi:hypothetical protein